jgi:hypothetical protein
MGKSALANSHSERQRGPADQLWRNTLLQIPTVFGRLAFLAALRDPVSGKYHEDSLNSLLGPQDADRALRHSHYQVFSQWLAFSLADQKDDLSQYFGGLGRGWARPNWSSAAPYRQLIPASAREVERQLYLADLETLLELLKAEHADAF